MPKEFRAEGSAKVSRFEREPERWVPAHAPPPDDSPSDSSRRPARPHCRSGGSRARPAVSPQAVAGLDDGQGRRRPGRSGSSSRCSASPGTRTTSARRVRRAATRGSTSSRPRSRSPSRPRRARSSSTSPRRGPAACSTSTATAARRTYYIHLNNDLTMTNDNKGRCKPGIAFAPGLKSGQRVAAGEPVGFVGDSGDANGIHAHLHFESHPHDGGAASPFTALNRAYRLLVRRAAEGPDGALAEGQRPRPAAERAQRPGLEPRRPGDRPEGQRDQPRSLGRHLALHARSRTPSRSSSGKERATVWTEVMPVTLDAQLGKPGAITAERVLLVSSHEVARLSSGRQLAAR